MLKVGDILEITGEIAMLKNINPSEFTKLKLIKFSLMNSKTLYRMNLKSLSFRRENIIVKNQLSDQLQYM